MGAFPHAIMSDHLIPQKDVLFLRSSTNVVDNQRGAPGCFIRDNSYVQNTAPQIPSDDVAGAISFRRLELFGHHDLMPLEIPRKVWHPAMINVFVRAFESPFLRVGAEILLHVFVDLLLKVKAYLPKRPNDYVAADSRVKRNITAWVFERGIGRVILLRHPDLLPSSRDDADTQCGIALGMSPGDQDGNCQERNE